MSLAEKFQITVPYKEEAQSPEGQWQTFESQRCVDDVPQPDMGTKFNIIPDTDINNQYRKQGCDDTYRLNNFAKGFGGNTDVTNNLDPKSLEKGYTRREMKATDDQYSGEHVDLFYGEAVDEKGQVGFAERNNYLDRI